LRRQDPLWQTLQIASCRR